MCDVVVSVITTFFSSLYIIVDNAPCDYGQLQLVGGNSAKEGRVEICIGGLWGTICDDQYDRVDAAVICRQLGFKDIGTYYVCVRTYG